MIRRAIHQFWDSAEPPASVMALMESWQRLNPGYAYTLWNDETAEQLIRQNFGHEAALCFRGCTIPAMRADVFRYVVLYVEGGIYADADERCIAPLAPLLERDVDIILYRMRNIETDPRMFRIRTGFMAAVPGSYFFGALAAQVFENIRTRCAADLWRVTGPGALTSFYRDYPHLLRTARIHVINRTDIMKYIEIAVQIDYKKDGRHWREAQKTKSLFSPALPDAEALPSFQWAENCVIGHPGCGLGAVADTMRRAGLDIGDGRLGADGMAGWTLTPRLERRGACLFLNHCDGEDNYSKIFVGRVIKALRHPLEAVPQIMAINEAHARQNGSFQYRARIIKDHFGIDLMGLEADVAAATSYGLWSELASAFEDCQILSEEPDLSLIFPWIPSHVLPHSPLLDLEQEEERPGIDLRATREKLPRVARPPLRKIVQTYNEYDKRQAFRPRRPARPQTGDDRLG